MENTCCPMPKKQKTKIEKKRVIVDKTTEVLANEEMRITRSKKLFWYTFLGMIFAGVLMVGVDSVGCHTGLNKPLLYFVQMSLAVFTFYLTVKLSMMSIDDISDRVTIFKLNTVLTKNPPYKATEFTVLKEYKVISIGLETYLLEDVNGHDELLEVSHSEALKLYKEKVEE